MDGGVGGTLDFSVAALTLDLGFGDWGLGLDNLGSFVFAKQAILFHQMSFNS